jgi:threonine dehydrogenase-like Zn-dependent dehydrogenase
MRAIILEKFGGLDSLVYADIPKPLPKMGEIVIEVKGFGINHAELHMRRGEWAESAEVSGIEYSASSTHAQAGSFPWRQGSRAHGRPRANHQRQLRRIHPCARRERCPHRLRTAVVVAGGVARNLTRPPGLVCFAI